MIPKEIDLGDDALAIIELEFTGLYSGPLQISSIKGGQTAADDALRNLDITRYAEDRSEVLPYENRRATVLAKTGGAPSDTARRRDAVL